MRKKIWITLDECFLTEPDLALETLSKYAEPRPDVEIEIMNFDLPFVVGYN